MKRKGLSILFFVMLATVLSFNVALAEEYPKKAINFLIPFGAGGSADIMGRHWPMGQKIILGNRLCPSTDPELAVASCIAH